MTDHMHAVSMSAASCYLAIRALRYPLSVKQADADSAQTDMKKSTRQCYSWLLSCMHYCCLYPGQRVKLFDGFCYTRLQVRILTCSTHLMPAA